MPAYVYILRCRDESLYTGWTNDLEQRVAAHNTGKGAKYTKSGLKRITAVKEQNIPVGAVL